jgi:hypothetical protein
MELNRENIFNEIWKLYAAIPQSIIYKPLFLFFNENTYNIYKIGYGIKFGYSLPENLNFMGIQIIVDNSINDNVMYIKESYS